MGNTANYQYRSGITVYGCRVHRHGTGQWYQTEYGWKGRAIDNIFIERFWRTIKYEHVYLNPTNDGQQLFKGIHTYMNYYNMERRHESLNYCTPYSQYQQNTN
ncbi:MAG: transposase [Saprospiraceae bacterium]|nr:transposase [Saprospiraceae bacterium]